jgi:hypothetical protein
MDTEKYYKRLSLEDELAAWDRLLAKNENGTEEYEKSAREKFRVEQEIAEKRKELEEQEKQRLEDIKNVQSQIQDEVSKLADEIVKIYQEYYENKKKAEEKAVELQEDALDKQRNTEKDAHTQRMKELDSEINKNKELYDVQINAIDDEANSEDYSKNLESKRQEELEIEKKLNIAKLNTSKENKKNIEDLEKQLADKRTDIADFVAQHDRDVRKHSLQDALETQQKEVNKQKDAAQQIEDTRQQAYELEKNRLDGLKNIIEQNYENLINDDKKYNEIRQQVMSGSFAQIQKDFAGFTNEIAASSSLIGLAISTNLIAKINDMGTQMTSVSSILAGHFSELGTTLESDLTTKLKDLMKQLDDLNKVKFDDLKKEIGSINVPSSGLVSPANNGLPAGIGGGFGGGGSYGTSNPTTPINESAGSSVGSTFTPLPYDPSLPAGFGGGQYMEKHHGGGWIGNIQNILSNLKSDEVPAILQTGEFVLSRAMIKDISSSKQAVSNSESVKKETANQDRNNNPPRNITLNLSIANLHGTKKDVDYVLKGIHDGLYRLGLT